MAKIQAFYKAHGRASATKDAALKYFGYANSRGEGGRVLSALKSFGLIEGRGDRIKLTRRGIDIVTPRETDAQRIAALRLASTTPAAYRHLLKKYTTGLPSDTTLKSELVAVKKFSPKAVDEFIRGLRETLAFAGLSDTQEDSGSAIAIECDPEHQPDAINIGDHVQWETQGILRLPEPRRVRAISEDGQWAFLDGSGTGVPRTELSVVDAAEIDMPLKTPAEQRAVESRRSGDLSEPRLSIAPPRIRSYAWALSGDFNATLQLFGEARTEEDLDALRDYIEITVKALKRSLKLTPAPGPNK